MLIIIIVNMIDEQKTLFHGVKKYMLMILLFNKERNFKN
jgi:hypothetical protein